MSGRMTRRAGATGLESAAESANHRPMGRDEDEEEDFGDDGDAAPEDDPEELNEADLQAADELEVDLLVAVDEPGRALSDAPAADPADVPVEIAPGSRDPAEAIRRLRAAGPSASAEWRSVGEDGPFGKIDVRVDTSGAAGRDGRYGRRGRDGKAGRHLKNGKTSKGGNGTNGSAGRPGTRGRNARQARVNLDVRGGAVWTSGSGGSRRVDHGLDIDASGGRGGSGGAGGSGGSGGYGTPSGRRGLDGSGGNGGNGGNGADVIVSSADAHLFGLVRRADCSGGAGGSGGWGSPSGNSGDDGEDGAIRYRLLTGGVATEGETFGLAVRRLTVALDDTVLNGCLTRGSAFTVTGAEVQNVGEIPVKGPFGVVVVGMPPLLDEGEALVCGRGTLHEDDTAEADGEVAIAVPRNAHIGRWQVRATTSTRRGGVEHTLNQDWKVQSFEFHVNHRLAPAPPTVETEDEAAVLASMVRWLDPLWPSPQLSTYSGLLLGDLMALDAPTGAPPSHVEGAAGQLTGELFDAGEFRRAVSRFFGEETLRTHVGVVRKVSTHFFRTMPLSTRVKTLDAAFWVISRDRRISAEERAAIVGIAARLGFEEVSLTGRFPALAGRDGAKVAAAPVSG